MEAASTGRYVYCVITTGRPLGVGIEGMLGEPVYTVACGRIAAVVSNAPLDVLVNSRTDNYGVHERVTHAIMQSEPAVLPITFGTILKDTTDVTDFLHASYAFFCDVLEQMHGKWEYALKVLWDRQAAIDTLADDDGNVPRTVIGEGWLARKKAERRFAAALQRKAANVVDDILGRLQDVSLAHRIHAPSGEAMVLNAAVLVSHGAGTALQARVRELSASRPHLTFNCRGPAPPYSFTTPIQQSRSDSHLGESGSIS